MLPKQKDIYLWDVFYSQLCYVCISGARYDISDDSRLNMTSSYPSGDARPLEQEGPTTSASGVNVSSTSILSGAAEILALFRILGEGYRLSCLYRCQVLHFDFERMNPLFISWYCIDLIEIWCFLVEQDALDVYNKLPHKHYQTGWVLSQVKVLFVFITFSQYSWRQWLSFYISDRLKSCWFKFSLCVSSRNRRYPLVLSFSVYLLVV